MNPDFGHYHIIEKLGVGGMATVYLAVQKSLNRKVVLKVMHPHLQEDETFVARFEREAKSAAILRHENIVQVIDYGQADGTWYIAMELVEGEDLKKWLARHDQPPVEITVHLLYEICSGLNHAHSHHIVHRDLKPANLMVGPGRAPKIADFGLARITKESTVLTTHDSMIGTVPYMSPECATGVVVDERSDLFSLGIVAYELLGGKRPFNGDSSASVIHAIVSTEPPPLHSLNPILPVELHDVVLKMLEKDPDNRYQSAAEIMKDLEPIIDALDVVRGRDLLARYFDDPDGVADSLRKKRAEGREASDTRESFAKKPAPGVVRKAGAAGRWGLLAAGLATTVAIGIVLLQWTGREEPAVAVHTAAASDTMKRARPAVGPAAVIHHTKTTRAVVDTKRTMPAPTAEKSIAEEPAGRTEPESKPTPVPEVKEKTIEAAPKEEPVIVPAKKEVEKEPPAPPKEGTLKITAKPSATFYIDGEIVAREISVLTHDLEPGDHRVRLEHPYYVGREWKAVSIEPGGEVVLVHDFLAGCGHAFLTVTTNRIPSPIWIDGLPVDMWTPQRQIPVTPGPHTITVKKEGFLVEEGSIETICREGETTELSFTLHK